MKHVTNFLHAVKLPMAALERSVRLLLAALALAVPAAAQAAEELPFAFYHDFRGKPIPAELTFFNADEGKFFKEEPEGLRITLPNTWTHKWGGVGFRTSFGFGGDFEVTATVEILHNETPRSGYGVGALLALSTQASRASLGRLVRPDGRQIILVERNRPKWAEERVPCDDAVVRLRLKRTGPTLYFLWAPGTAGNDFQEVHQCEFGSDDIERIRLSGITGQQPCNLDVRLIDLRVRSQKSDGVLQQEGQQSAGPVSGRWKIWVMLALIIALSLGVLLTVLLRAAKVRERAAAARK
jgi:hypothetical protein